MNNNLTPIIKPMIEFKGECFKEGDTCKVTLYNKIIKAKIDFIYYVFEEINFYDLNTKSYLNVHCNEITNIVKIN